MEKKQARSGGLFFCGARNTGDNGNFGKGGRQKVKKNKKGSNKNDFNLGKLRFPVNPD
jgi:hypothetical protein